MYESSGQLTNKLIQTQSGNQHHETGSFDECLDSLISNDDDDHQMIVPLFQPQYCTVFFDVSNNMTALAVGEPVEDMTNFVKSSVSFCIPSTCTALDLRSAVAHRIASSHVSVITNEHYCHTLDKISIDKQFDTATTIAW